MTTHVRLRITEIRATAIARRTFVVAVELVGGGRFDPPQYVHPVRATAMRGR